MMNTNDSMSKREVPERNVASERFPSRLLSRESFWFPVRSGERSGWTEHAPFAFWLTKAHRPRVFVELGTHTGYSYLAVCQAVKALSLNTRCYAVDTWQGDEHAGFYGLDIYEELKAYANAHYAEFSRLVRSTFEEAQSHFEDGSIDLLHIDGAHRYEDVKADFESWKRKLAPNAIVLFHDINVRERNFGVFKYWDEIKSGRPSFEFWHGHGLGVLGVGDKFSPEVQELFSCSNDPDIARLAQEAYSRLGAALTTHFMGARDINELKAVNAQLLHELEAVQTANAQLLHELQAVQGAYSELQQHADMRLAQLNHLQPALEYREAELRSLHSELLQVHSQLDEARQEAAQLKYERHIILGSSSWRLTSPLRKVMRWVRPRT